MKILRIIARLNVGGPARHVVWLTRDLQDDEFQSTLIAGTVPKGEADMEYFAAKNGVEPIYVAELSRELSPKDIVSLWKIFRLMLRYQPDIVHTHTAKAGTVGRVAAFAYRWLTWRTLVGRPRRVKVVHTFHGHVFHSYYGRAKTQVFILIERLLARFATDRIVVISPQQRDEIGGKYKVGVPSQFQVIPLGIEIPPQKTYLEKRRTLRDELRISDDEILVGFVGRLTAIKNIGLLLAAARSVYEYEPSLRSRFAVIGDGELRPSLESEAESLGLTDKISFLGNRVDVGDLIPGIDIMVLTSENEGTPLSLIEAMSFGVPFVSTAVGGVVDLAGETIETTDQFRICERGIVTEPGSAESVARALIYLAKDGRLRKSLSAQGREFVAGRYSVERLVSDIKGLYRELIED